MEGHRAPGMSQDRQTQLGNVPAEASFSRGGAFPTLQMWNVPKRFFECSSGALSRRIGQNSDLVATRRAWTPARAGMTGPTRLPGHRSTLLPTTSDTRRFGATERRLAPSRSTCAASLRRGGRARGGVLAIAASEVVDFARVHLAPASARVSASRSRVSIRSRPEFQKPGSLRSMPIMAASRCGLRDPPAASIAR
jgi:hypothetical protein